MPIYEYQCQSCNHEFEALQKISDPLLTDCPACEKPELRKKVSAAAFRLKGGGWYETDFKTGKKKNVAGEGGAESKSGSDSGAGKSETKSSSSGTGSAPAAATSAS
ncbi:FmdB family zinc ribbon protein [Gilvimarinus sp. F26214L]|uniref:FmdB family zinc ribbon protein n=1 Tax=Gilvimarinus sp. DZF01 TaxID=3461371 RepID=UPI004045E80A